jgi:hypothetical protein
VKRWVFLFSLLVVSCGLSGCGSIGRESAFMAGFSLGSIIEANDQFLIAKGTVSSGTVSEPPVPFFQKHEEAIVQIDSSHIPTFMEAVRSDIEISLTSSGAKICGRGGDHPEHIEQALASQGLKIRGRTSDRQGQEGRPTDIAGFSLRYSDGKVDGVVNAWGVRGKGTSLILIVLITESQSASPLQAAGSH